jgi:hypothetical protein
MTQQGVLYAQKVYLDQYDLSGNMTAASVELGIDGLDSTRYSTSLSGNIAHTEDPGLSFAQFEAASLWEAGAGKIDAVAAALQRASDSLITWCPQTGTAGERAYLLRAMESSYRHGAQVGQMLKADLSAKCSSIVRQGYVLFNGSVSATSSGTAFQLGAVTGSQFLYTWIHVLSGAGSLTARVQSDTSGFPSATTQKTFTAIAAATSEYLTPLAGAITDDYWRADFTVASGGPFAVVIGMAIL